MRGAALAVAVVLVAFVGGVAFRAGVAAPVPAKNRNPDRPRRETLVRDGRVIGRALIDPHTGARTELPIDAPDPRPKED